MVHVHFMSAILSWALGGLDQGGCCNDGDGQGWNPYMSVIERLVGVSHSCDGFVGVDAGFVS